MFIKNKITYVYLIINTCTCFVLKQNFELHNQKKLHQCLNKIFNKTNVTSLFLIDLRNKYQDESSMKQETISVLKMNDLNKYRSIIHHFQYFMLFVETEINLIHILEKLSASWKSKYYFISINTFINKTKLFEILWNNYIYNIILIQNINGTISTFTYYPFSGGNCNDINPFYLGDCDAQQDYFQNKIPDNLNGCEYRFLALLRPPFVININVSIDNPKVQGFEVTLIHNIARILNITIKSVHNPYQDWGSLLPNGTFTEMFGLLQNKRADIMYGGLHYGYIASKYFDLSFSHKIVNSAWFVPAPLEIPKWQNLLIVFERNVWLLLLMTFVVKTFYWWLITKKNLNYCFLYIWSIFLLISVKVPQTFILKIQFYICTVSFMIITTSYISKLIGVLTKPIYEKPITTVEELLEKNLKVGFHPAYENRINDSLYSFLLENYVKCTSNFVCVNRTAFQRDLAVIKLDVQIFYMIPRFYTTSSGKTMINWFNGIIGHSHLGIYAQKGLPIMEKINRIICSFVESGLINKWEDDMKYVVRKETSDDDLKSLSLHHLQTPFYILLFGFIISSLVFLYELFTSLYERICNNYLRFLEV